MKTFDAMVTDKETYCNTTLCEVTGIIKKITKLVIPNEVLEKVDYIYFPGLTVKNNYNKSLVSIYVELIPGNNGHREAFYRSEYYQTTMKWATAHTSVTVQNETKDVGASIQWMLKYCSLL